MYCIIMTRLILEALLMCFRPLRLCSAFHNSDNKDKMHSDIVRICEMGNAHST